MKNGVPRKYQIGRVLGQGIELAIQKSRTDQTQEIEETDSLKTESIEDYGHESPEEIQD